ncbi:hypothetical protein F8388_004344 [Cannabis sativa]|uniref:Uncharacterized protein n=1 Tax=Cannabis sativa TaxID=3483 RepID=A0A7J6HAC1_CANSA|nr:hypothetical protein F8388_004344 [Cannabis sativa]
MLAVRRRVSRVRRAAKREEERGSDCVEFQPAQAYKPGGIVGVLIHGFLFCFEQWIFWVGPLIGALAAAAYHQYILRATAIKALGSERNATN